MFWTILSFVGLFFKGPLARILDTVDKRTDAGVERDRIKSEVIATAAKAQVEMMNGPGRWLLLFFIAPLGTWFSAVVVYSILWCQGCAFPQQWEIAALPPPLDEWAGIIIASMFGYGGVLAGARILRR